jgi:class 3 adenylate cyclase
MASDETGTLARLKACRAIIDRLIASHRGRIFNTAGDSVVADFASAVDADQCAVAVQTAITTENATGPDGGEGPFPICPWCEALASKPDIRVLKPPHPTS